MEQAKIDPELLDEHKDDLLEMLNMAYLVQFLEDINLLTENDVKSLHELEHDRRAAAERFLSILKAKWHAALSGPFIGALGMEKKHAGHKRLYEILKPKLKPSHEEEMTPKDAVSQHQVSQPVKHLINPEKNTDRSSLVLPTSINETAGTDSDVGDLVSGKLGVSSSTIITPRRRGSSPLEALMYHQIGILTEIGKNVRVLAHSASSPYIPDTFNIIEDVTIHQRSVSCDNKPVKNLVSHKKNSGDLPIIRQQVTKDDSPKIVS